MLSFIDRYFGITKIGSNFKTEILSGLTSFMAMSYIIFVNPNIMAPSGMPVDAVMVSTCLAAAIATIMMGLYAKYPIGLAPSMGINAFFTYTLVIGVGLTWEQAMAAVFLEGILFIIITFTNIRQSVLNAIPDSLIHGISAGIGLFLAFIGFQSSGIVVANNNTLVNVGNLAQTEVLLSIFGFFLTTVLYIKKVRGSILISILSVTAVSIFLGVSKLPDGILAMPPSISPIFFKMDFSLATTLNFIILVIVLCFMDIFNTLGTLIGVANRSGLLDENGKFLRPTEAFMSDAVGTTIGSALGVTTVTTYIESVTGIEEGGKTGMVAVVIGICFLLSVFFYPIVAVVPSCATSPALIFVGMLMLSVVKQINFHNFRETIPAVMTILIMPFTYNIATGIEFGIISYVIINLFSGGYKDVSILMLVLSILFVLKEIFFII